MNTKLKMKRKILTSALMVLFIVSIIPVLAGEDEEVDLTTTVIGDGVEVELTVTVIAPLVADAGGPYSCYRYQTIQLDGSGSHDGLIVKYEWDFGDGTTGTGIKPSHTYSSTGTFTVTLTVTDEDDLTASDTTTVKVSIKPSPEPPRRPNKKPKADAGPNMKISVGSTIHFSGAESYDKDGRIVSYRWDFGDETTARGEEVDHTYLEPGHYTVTLFVIDDRWAVDSDKCHVKVWEPSAPVSKRLGELVPGKKKGHIVNASEAANTLVTLDTTNNVTVTILRYEENPHPDDPMPANALPIYVDVEVSNSTAVEWPIYVEIHYTDEEAEGLDEDALGIYYWKDGAWHRCSHTGVDTERNVVWAYMTAEEASGSPILAGYTPLKPAEFTVSNLVITPEKIEPGEEVTMSMLVTNVGEETGNYTLTLNVEGWLTTIEVTLAGGESETRELKLFPEAEGTYKVEVDGLTGGFTVKALPIPLKPAEFVITDLMVSPTKVPEGDPVTVRVTITNIGEEEGRHTVKLKIDGLVTELADITLFGGSSTTITFTLTEAVGEYSLEIEGLTAVLTVEAKPAEPINIYLVAGIIICAIAIIYMLWKGKPPSLIQAIRPKAEEEEPEED